MLEGDHADGMYEITLRNMLSVANSRSHAFRKLICAQEKVPTKLYEYALGGIRTHVTDPVYNNTRLEGNLIRHGGDRCFTL